MYVVIMSCEEVSEMTGSFTEKYRSQRYSYQTLGFFLKIFFLTWAIFKSLYWIYYNIASVLYFLAMKHVDLSSLMTPHTSHWKAHPSNVIKLTPPALEGKVLTTRSPGKSHLTLVLTPILLCDAGQVFRFLILLVYLLLHGWSLK